MITKLGTRGSIGNQGLWANLRKRSRGGFILPLGHLYFCEHAAKDHFKASKWARMRSEEISYDTGEPLQTL